MRSLWEKATKISFITTPVSKNKVPLFANLFFTYIDLNTIQRPAIKNITDWLDVDGLHGYSFKV